MTRIIAVVSGKGGVGKTTTVANIGAALADMGLDVTVLDANLTTPNLGIHLGIPLFPVTLHDVLKGRAHITDAVYDHDNGLKVIPAGLSLRDLRGIDSRNLAAALLDMLGSTDIVLMDVAAGLGKETLAALEAADEMVIVTNPDLPSVTDALKAVKLGQQMGVRILGTVVNRRTGRKHEMRSAEIRSMLDDTEILAEIPEDKRIAEAISARSPVVHFAPRSASSQRMHQIANRLIGRDYRVSEPWYRRVFAFRR